MDSGEVQFASEPTNFDTPGWLAIEAPDGDAVPALFPSPGPPTSGESRMMYAKIGRPDGPISIEYLPFDETSKTATGEPLPLRTLSADAMPHALAGTDELIVELGASVGLPELIRRAYQSELAHTTVVTIDSPSRCRIAGTATKESI